MYMQLIHSYVVKPCVIQVINYLFTYFFLEITIPLLLHYFQTKLYIVPPLESYGWGSRPLQLGLAGNVQYRNASLALQLSQYWIDSQVKGKIRGVLRMC